VMKEVGPSLARLRLSRGYSQQQLATMIGSSQPHIARIESGRGELFFDTAGRLADALGVKLDELRPLIDATRAARKV
jgi:transcriptional regulator with XRE-family HTH domain